MRRKHILLMLLSKHNGCLNEKAHMGLHSKPNHHFWGNIVLIWRRKKRLDRQTLIIPIWVRGKYFLKNKPSEPITSRKIQIFSGTHDKIQDFKWKFKFSKVSVTMTLITHQYLKLKTVLMRLVVILTSVIFFGTVRQNAKALPLLSELRC